MRRMIILVGWTITQIILFVYLFFMPAYTSVVYPLLVVLGIFLALTILSDNSKLTSSKLSWITIILSIPIIGMILYLTFGLGHMSRYRKKILENSRMKFYKNQQYIADYTSLNMKQQSLVNYLDNMRYGTSYLHNGGEIECYTDGPTKYKQMFKDIEAATSYIHIEYYIIKAGKLYSDIVELLIKKAHEGVEVRIMSDYVGARTITRGMIRHLEDNGIKFVVFNELKTTLFSKLSNFRDHRKIVVIDGQIAYTGGFNIGDEYIDLDPYYKHWQDFHIRISYSSVVLEYETFFAQTWYYETKENLFVEKYYPKYSVTEINKKTLVYPYVDGPDSVETYVRDMFIKAIMGATKKICIATPYFIPDSVLYDSLLIQADSGVEIIMITPGLPDKKIVKVATESYYRDLLKAGVKIYEYNGFIHSKKILVDDETAIVGTANFDMRSFNLSFEACTLLMNGPIIVDINQTFIDEIANANKVKIEKIDNQSKIKSLAQVVLRLFAPLF